MTTNAQRISRYLEKNAAKSSARKRLANLSHISAPASFFHPYVDAAQNEMLAAATGEDEQTFDVEHPYLTLALLSAAGAGAGRLAGKHALKWGDVDIGLPAGGGVSPNVSVGGLVGGLAGGALGAIGATALRRYRLAELKKKLLASGIDEAGVREELGDTEPGAVKGALYPLVGYSGYGAHESNKAQTAKALLGKGKSDALNAENVGTLASRGLPMPLRIPADMVASGIGGSRASELHDELL